MITYLDCAATTPVDARVADRVMQYMTVDYGNAGSRTHGFGQRARRAVEAAREQVARVVGCGRGEVVFTSGATEADNLAILGLAEHGLSHGLRHIVSTQIEHHAVRGPLQALRARGFSITLVPPTPGGWVSPQAIREAVREETLLVSVMHVNNETGVIQPIQAIARCLDDHPAFFHVDGAQSFGKLLEPLRDARIDLISVSGHKIHAPQGIGALITRRREGARPPLAPLMHGGGQELGIRPGTLSVPLIAGFGLAAELAMAEGLERARTCEQFRRTLLDGLAPLHPLLIGDPARSVPHIANIAFPGVAAEDAIEALSDRVAISTGAACTTQTRTCSHVLEAMGLGAEAVAGALRFSWCHLTPDVDWPAMVETIRKVADSCDDSARSSAGGSGHAGSGG